MRLSIHHHAEYACAAPVAGSVQYLRLWPRDDPTQSIVRWRLDAPGQVTPWCDGFGNVVHTVVAAGPVSMLPVDVEGEVDTVETHGVLPPDRTGPPPEAYLRPTLLTAANEPMRDFAAASRASRNRGTLTALHDLMTGIHRRVASAPGDGGTGAAEALARGAGTCQDLAHLFIACCRVWGVPARYVSGYLHTQAEEDHPLTTHSWAEALVEDLGWVSFDPGNCRSATQAYVRLAVAFDHLGAAPVRGVLSDGGDDDMLVRTQMMQAEQ